VHTHHTIKETPRMADSSSTTSKKWIPGFLRFLADATKIRPTKAFYDVITLDPAIGRRIGLGGGIKDKVPPFLGLQPFDVIWFSIMPWREIVLERNALVLIADPKLSGLEAHPFGIRIPINPDYAVVLARFTDLDVRQIDIDATGSVTQLGNAPLMKMPLSSGRVERLGARARIIKEHF
jgi:hypothetical protein